MMGQSGSLGHDLNGALLFVRVVEAGSLRGAARLLGVPKSTVSRRLQVLEEQLGAQLLQRTTRKLHLTDVGRAYYEQASRAVNALLDAERAVAGHLAEPRGRLRITSSVNIGTTLLPDILFEFIRAHPAVEVDVDLSERIVDLVEEGFDLAIRAGPLPDSALVAHRLGGAELRTYASPAYLKRRGRPRVPADLLEHDCLLFGPRREWVYGKRPHVERLAVRGRLHANNMELLRDAAVKGLGVARMPAIIAAPFAQAGKLEELLEGFVPDEAPLHAVYPSTRFVTPAVRAFIDLLATRVGEVTRRVGRASK